MSKVENENVTVTGLLEMVSEEMCNNYCKVPGMYECKTGNIDEENEMMERMSKEWCDNCPLIRLL